MLVLLASPRWRWCPGEYLLVPYGFRLCMKPANIRLDTSAIWEKLIKPTYRAHLFDEVSTPLTHYLQNTFLFLNGPSSKGLFVFINSRIQLVILGKMEKAMPLKIACII